MDNVKADRLVATIEKIEAFIRPFKPPVQSFERSIRESPLRILISVLISSRTKDEVTHQASANLFKRADTAEKIAALGEEQVAALIYPVGFYRQKAKNIIRICRQIQEGGQVPANFEELTALPGVGRKTANLVLALAFQQPAIAVDIHVFRISRRLGWAQADKPELVEAELKKIFPQSHWRRINQALVGFGQTVCKPQKPRCHICFLNDECPYYLNKKKSNDQAQKDRQDQ
jgi:endonuclease-3